MDIGGCNEQSYITHSMKKVKYVFDKTTSCRQSMTQQTMPIDSPPGERNDLTERYEDNDSDKDSDEDLTLGEFGSKFYMNEGKRKPQTNLISDSNSASDDVINKKAKK